MFIDHDILIRHFIRSGALVDIERNHDVTYVFPEHHRRVKTNLSELGLRRVRTVHVSETRAYRWRRLYHARILRSARRSPDRRLLEAFWRDSLGRRSYLRSWLASLPLIYTVYSLLVKYQNGANVSLEQLLRDERIDLVLHPTVLEGLFVTDLVRWGRSVRKPVVFLMNSWDNPSVKAMVTGYADRLVVWGEQTRRHAIEHLGWPADKIACLGAAQFELYARPVSQPRGELLRAAGLREDRRTLLYAGSSKGLNEVSHLREIEAAILSGRLPDWQVIFRPHPWRGVISDEPDFESFPWTRICLDPQMTEYYRASRRDRSLMFMANYGHTHDLLSAVDAVVSPLSTILLEAAMHARPVLAYVPEEEVKGNAFMTNVAQMRFFREFFERVGGGPCVSRDQFITACRALMAGAEAGTGTVMRERTQYFVVQTDRSYGEKVAELVDCLLLGGDVRRTKAPGCA